MANQVRFPFGEADVQNVTSAATIDLTVTNAGLTYVKLSTLSAAATVNVTAVAANMVDGAMLFIEIPSDGTARNVTPGTLLQSPTIAGVISKTKVAGFMWVTDKFIKVSEELIN